MEVVTSKLKNMLKCLADVVNDHWIWKTIILFIPSIYLPIIIKYATPGSKLVNANNQLTGVAKVITVIIYLLVLGVNILSSFKATRDKVNESEREKQYKTDIEDYKVELEEYENTLGVYNRLMMVLGKVCDFKLGGMYTYIEDSLKSGTFKNPYNESICPEKQLKSIAKEIKNCLSDITQPPLDSITVSMAYEIPDLSIQLKWVDQQEVAQCMKLSALKTTDSTMFYRVYSGQSDYLFFNDKILAEQNNCYAFDKKDQRSNKIGSIVCEEIALENDGIKIARIILTISTYGYKFTDSDDPDVLDNMSRMIEEVILQQFDKRIRIELAYLYVKNHYFKKK